MKINAAFQGGGMKGIALAGAVDAAMRRGYEFHQVAGTSSGAIIAALLAAGYTAEEIKKIIISSPFSSFLSRAPIFNIKYIGPTVRLFWKKGLYSGERLEYWMDQLLRKKGVHVFGDLEPNKLRCIASDISHNKLMVLPGDLVDYGIKPEKFPISKAIRMSTSIPYFFDPVRLIKQNTSGKQNKADLVHYVVDGAILSNFPLWLFDKKFQQNDTPYPTIGFQLVGRNESSPNIINGPLTMLQAIFTSMMGAFDERYIETINRFRTIKIPALGVQTTEFHLSEQKSLALYQSGYTAANEFFSTFTINNYEEEYTKSIENIK